MPRQPRYFIPDIPQHVLIRGVDKQATFFAPEDYTLFLEQLAKHAQEHGCSIHGYVLMTNHVHLLLTPMNPRAIPLLMQGLGRGYVQTINRKYNRTGTLWQGRYKACLVQSNDYFLVCQRYIELNPVRAMMIRDPAEYPFSSYRSNAFAEYSAILTPHACYVALGASTRERCKNYRRLFEQVLDREMIDTIRNITNSCRLLGNDRFIDQIEAMLGRRVRPAKMGRPRTK